METKKIREFVIKDHIDGFFAVRKKDVREYARGQFVSLELGDCSGRVAAVMWDPDQFALAELEEGMVVKARGVVGEYQNKIQLTVEKIRLATDNEFHIEDIMPHSAQSVEERKARLLALTDKIENSYIKNLVMSFWSDETFMNAFLKAAAGKLWHHAYIGGLSEHAANVAELALKVATGYDFLNKDLLIFGGLFHDAGKLSSYSSDMNMIDYTDEGRLLGHIALMDRWLCERASKIEAFPDKLLTKLRHLILSHHGELQYASPVVPMMPEAFVLYYCDEIDSKMGAIDLIRQKQDGVGWSEYVKMLDRFLYFGDRDT
ncbi:MAG: OB-fold nucleic acid binding domain-containing protein [candidate division Zixibacteria bacterium]|nr:OB-fold nucleic acid binding domain-containing protein [candidate division Zixibacteria bacterium]